MLDKNYNDNEIEIQREPLKFNIAAKETFNWLGKEYGFRCIVQKSTFVRFENEDLFINIYHGRMSYEINLEFGRKSDAGQIFHIDNLLQLYKPGDGDYFYYAATNQESVVEGLKKLSELFKNLGASILGGDYSLFDKLRKNSDKLVDERILNQKIKLSKLKAEEAFKKKDYVTAVKFYKEAFNFLSDLELKKLKYAQNKLSKT